MPFFDLPPPLGGQFSYPEPGQKQTFFDRLPPHLVNVVKERPSKVEDVSPSYLLRLRAAVHGQSFGGKNRPTKPLKSILFVRLRIEILGKKTYRANTTGLEH